MLTQKLTSFNCTIQTQILKPSPIEIVLHNGHQLSHLTEKQHSMIGSFQFRQNSVQQFKFARSPKSTNLISKLFK